MNGIPSFLDTPAKRWLTAMAAAFLLCVTVLVHSFLNAQAPEEVVVTAPAPSAPVVVEHVRNAPAWNNSQQTPRAQRSQEAVRVSPFAAEDAAAEKQKKNPVADQEAVHVQADYLRKLIAKGALPKGLGDLTKEQVDQMEKDGVMIE